MHCILAFKSMPPAERAAWKVLLDHYVFADQDPAAHIPPELRGVLGPLTPELVDKLRQLIGARRPGKFRSSGRSSPVRIFDRSMERFRLILSQHDYLHDGAVEDRAGVFARGGEHDGVVVARWRISRHCQRHPHFDGLVAP
jgi:hypothetical protein